MENVIDLLKERQFIDTVTSDEIRDHFEKKRRLYCGFDPTAPSLHLGNLVAIICLGWFQKCGHQPVIIVGGATGLIGDPSGKCEERPRLSAEAVAQNIESLKGIFEQVLDFSDEATRPIILDNCDWYSKMNTIEFLRDVGRNFRVGTMLAKDSVRTRMESSEGISFTEFTYQVLQGYDFHHLNIHHDVTLEIGGSDQWGNITAGTDAVRRFSGNTVFGMTYPLITRSDGSKFGKSEGGAIWLNSELLSPYGFYQYLINMSDEDVPKMMRFLTFLPNEKIREVEEMMRQPDYRVRSAQTMLAEEVTRIVHGDAGVESARQVTEVLRPGGKAELSLDLLHQVKSEIPSVEMKRSDVVGQPLDDVLVHGNVFASKSEIGRMVKNSGLLINNKVISDPKVLVDPDFLIGGSAILVGIGKKKKHLIFLP
ncbi:MAG: Tyrosine--tRNA ligase [Chlamydiia bacterium]|nr:Tyrosine--tRNA ligase [Chlamydiia bacterium]